MTQSTNRFKFIKKTILMSLLLGVILSSCKKDSSGPPPDKTALQAKIALAQSLYVGTAEGTRPTYYEIGSRTALKAVLDAANAVLANPNASQSDLTNAAAQLQAAMDVYATHLIKEIAAANLVGYWKFSGNTMDSSGKGNNGVLTAGHAYYGAGTPTLSTDRFSRPDKAYFFDKGGNVEVPFVTGLNPAQITISLWSKKSLGTPARTINTDTYTLLSLNRWNGYKLQYQSANKIFFTVKAVSGTDTSYYDRDDEIAVLDNDVWYHVVVTFKAGVMNFYINGDLVKSWTNTPFSPITLGTPINFIIGQDLPTNKYQIVDGDFQVAWGGFFTGNIDDVMFYNIALDGPQVKSIYDNQKIL